jgi:hypothetical protein
MKPSQLVMAGDPATGEAQMKLIDFEAITPTEDPWCRLHTPVYMPPEVRAQSAVGEHMRPVAPNAEGAAGRGILYTTWKGGR